MRLLCFTLRCYPKTIEDRMCVRDVEGREEEGREREGGGEM